MSKLLLQNQLKESSTTYLFYFFFGAHYAYLGKWGTQILFWLTIGGLGIWAIIDLFRISSLVKKHNSPIFAEIERLEKKEKDEDFKKQMMMMQALK